MFYVALSRARDRLFLYAPTQKSNGHNRPLSSFLDRVGSGLLRTRVSPTRNLPAAPDARDVPLIVEGALRSTGPQIALYERCPRRFFYTHILRIGGRRTATAFMQMHEAVRTVFQAVIADASIISREGDLEGRIVDAFAAHGLADHGYVTEYKGFATSMIQYFHAGTRRPHTRDAYGSQHCVWRRGNYRSPG